MKTRFTTLKGTLKKVVVGVIAVIAVAAPDVHAQAMPPRLVNFTNSTTGASGFATTNTLIAITNGTLTVTSSPIALYRGRGASLWAKFSPTNAVITNVLATFQFSPNGTDWSSASSWPSFTWNIPGLLATGSQVIGTNLPADFCDNFRFIRLNTIVLTNGPNTTGNIFLTNANGTNLTFSIEVFP